VRLVGIVRPEKEFASAVELFQELAGRKPLITAVAEMPYLALEWIMRRLRDAGVADAFGKFSVQKYTTPPRIDRGVAHLRNLGQDRGQGGKMAARIWASKSPRRQRHQELRPPHHRRGHGVGTSIWVNPKLRANEVKTGLLRMFLLNLHGAINAENKVLLLFNVPVANAAEVEAYLVRNNLFADEPSRISGKAYTEYSIEVDSASDKLPLARIRYELALMGARGIDTIPLTSSIPAVGAIEGW